MRKPLKAREKAITILYLSDVKISQNDTIWILCNEMTSILDPKLSKSILFGQSQSCFLK